MTSGGEVQELHTELRAWAAGMYTTEAAVELLIRGFEGRFAAAGNPWITENENGAHWVNFENLPAQTGALSSGERAYLHIAAAIGLGGTDGPTVNSATPSPRSAASSSSSSWPASPMRVAATTTATWPSTTSPATPPSSRSTACIRGREFGTKIRARTRRGIRARD